VKEGSDWQSNEVSKLKARSGGSRGGHTRRSRGSWESTGPGRETAGVGVAHETSRSGDGTVGASKGGPGAVPHSKGVR
jgi:hypothetical protein